jgi:hypothetical protein
MKRKTHQFLKAIFIVFLFNSCQKDCFFATGQETSEERSVEDFYYIQLWDNIDLELTFDTINKLQLVAGENILDNIETTTENGVLRISNQNRCNWLRSYSKPIRVELRLKRIYELEVHGTGNIVCTNTLKADSLMLNIWDAAGKIDLNIDTKKSTIRYHIGIAEVYYSGKTRLSYVSSNSFGPVDARNLQSEQTYISTIGSNNNYVWATEILEATIGASGNIYYKENPRILRTFIKGSGEVKQIEL